LVWGTGRWELARGFSRQHRIIPFASFGYASGLTLVHGGFAYRAGHTLAPVSPLTGGTTFLRHPIAGLLPVRVPRSPATRPTRGHGRLGWLASPGSAGTLLRGYGNINPLSIDYACRPRLRSRLTLGGLAWPRNPWSSGGGGSHSPLATHACILTRVASTAGSLRRFARHTTLPYPSPRLAGAHEGRPAGTQGNVTASAVCLSPATLSARNHLTSELLRTLSRVAASKPTSWLSVRLHILFHLAHAWGP
jgi:hypothetical protein